MSNMMNFIYDLNYRLGGGTLFQWVYTIFTLGLLGFLLVNPIEHGAVVTNTVLFVIGHALMFLLGG